MDSYRRFFARKRITVVGIGLLGGVEDIRFLAENDADLIVTDLKNEDEVAPALQVLKQFSNIHYTLGRHELSDFENRDLIIKAPAMPLDSPYFLYAKERNIPITMWAALFARFARQEGAVIVGITGTRGKTTVTAMLGAILEIAGKKVLQGGNVPGSSMLPQLPHLSSRAIVLLELDSWKLQGFREEALSPDIAVFTTFYPDHLNYYRHNMDAYLADKAEIFLHQREDNHLILGEQVESIVQKNYGTKIHAHIAVAHAEDLPVNWKLSIPGMHNRANAACALLAARSLGISDSTSKEALEKFRGVPGRIEFIREVRGIKIYNDTTATTPEATIIALQALDPYEKKNIILIMGGSDKGLDMFGLLSVLQKHCKRVLFLAGSGTALLKGEKEVFNSLDEAFGAAIADAVSGDAILLSPAFASFGMFKNEYDRGEQFLCLAAQLK